MKNLRILNFILILLMVFTFSKGLAKNQQVRQQLQQKKTSVLMARYKKLSVKQKTRLHHVILQTMSALELSRFRSNSLSSFYLWQYILPQANAQRSDQICFYGGHKIEGCNWNQARRDHSCQINGRTGVSCNSDLFAPGICVHTTGSARRQGLRNYSTTQACVYANTHIKAQQIKDSDYSPSPERINAIVAEQLTGNIWGSPDPEVWIQKRNGIITGVLGEDGLNQYLESPNAQTTLSLLQQINGACENIRDASERRHCEFFQKESQELLANQPTSRSTETESMQASTDHVARVPETCEQLRHCDGSTPDRTIREGSICIIERNMFPNISGSSDQTNALYSCPQEPPNQGTYFTKNIGQILNSLDDVGKRCIKIKRLYFSGHGHPGTLANGLNRNNTEQLKPYSCLMAEDAIVDIHGCSAGKSCAGKLFMQSMAENLFQDKKGTVISQNINTHFVAKQKMEVESISRGGSKPGEPIRVSGAYTGRKIVVGAEHIAREPFAYNQLEYNPSSSSNWNQLDSLGNYRDTIMTGLAESRPDEHQTIKDACLSDLGETIEDIYELERRIENGRTCSSLGTGCRTLYRGFVDKAKSSLEAYRRDPVQEFGTEDYQRLANHHLFLFDIHETLMQCHGGENITDYDCIVNRVFRTTRVMEQQQGSQNNSNQQRTRGQR